jgi:hypothetical protein
LRRTTNYWLKCCVSFRTNPHLNSSFCLWNLQAKHQILYVAILSCTHTLVHETTTPKASLFFKKYTQGISANNRTVSIFFP